MLVRLPAGGEVEADVLLAYVAERVAGYKQLRRIYFVDAIPRTGAGKVQIHILRDGLNL